MEPLKDIVPKWRQVYYQWKSLRNIPFRKQFFIGYDLQGNTFWELYNYNNPLRMRRIVFPKKANQNLVDYHLPPQWVQWLRHARPEAPSLKELIDDQNRQIAIKIKAAAADKKWKEAAEKEKQASLKGKPQPSDGGARKRGKLNI